MDPVAAAAGMSSLLIQAAQSAAQADGLAAPLASSDLTAARSSVASPAAAIGGGGGAGAVGGNKKKGPPLRRGKWTPEEESYANRLIQEFKSGLLPLTDGTTLRTFLSKLLNCDPMRISKKFVGSNCIGKQVFRRRNTDMVRLTTEHIQQSRAELSELERRFLERVAQTNRVKSTGVGGGGAAAANSAVAAAASNATPALVASGMTGVAGSAKGGVADVNRSGGLAGVTATTVSKANEISPSTHPWLAPPLGYKPGNGAAFAAANLANSRAAAAGRALLGGVGGLLSTPEASSNSLSEALERSNHQQVADAAAAADLPWHNSASAGLLDAISELQKRASQQNLVNALSGSQSNFFRSGSNTGFSPQAALSQLQQNASAARLADLASSDSLNSLMLKAGLSRDQLSQLAGGGCGGIPDNHCGLSSSSLSNMIQRQNSFDALMSLNFQSLQSIDNLANLMQTGNVNHQVPETGLKNADFFGLSSMASRQSFGGGAIDGGSRLGLGGGGVASIPSSDDLNAAARRLASAGRMESLLKNLSSSNMRGAGGVGGLDHGSGAPSSNTNLSNFLQSLQQQVAASNNNLSAASLIGSAGGGCIGGGGLSTQSAMSLANLFGHDSSTGLSALRMQDGLNQRNSSVDDFLSLVAAGDIPHQDPSLLNAPLMHQQQAGNQQQDVASKLLAQSQLLQQEAQQAAAASRSFSNFAAMAAASGQSPSSHHVGLFAAHQQQLQQQQQQQQQQQNHSKRKLEELGDIIAAQTPNKR